jgi:hypothetical protein
MLSLQLLPAPQSPLLWLEYVLKHALLCHHKIYIITRHEQIFLFASSCGLAAMDETRWAATSSVAWWWDEQNTRAKMIYI